MSTLFAVRVLEVSRKVVRLGVTSVHPDSGRPAPRAVFALMLIYDPILNLVYTEFKTVLSQQPVIEQVLPIPSIESDGEAAPESEYIYEQPAAEIFGRLLPKQIETQLYKSMLESVASEQGSRMTAMDSASKNAGELIDTLTLNMNRIRQAAITKEIIEIVSGAAAL